MSGNEIAIGGRTITVGGRPVEWVGWKWTKGGYVTFFLAVLLGTKYHVVPFVWLAWAASRCVRLGPLPPSHQAS